MTYLSSLKEKIKQIYSVYNVMINPVIKFLMAFIIFMQIKNTFHQENLFGNIFLILVLALTCSLLPFNGTVAAGIFLLLGQCGSISIEVLLFTSALLILLYAFFLRFAEKSGLILLLTPLSFSWNVPCALSVGCGLTKSPLSVVPAGCSVIFYYYIESVAGHIEIFKGSEPKMFVKNMKLLSEMLLGNKEMIVSLAAIVISMLLTGWIRKMSSEHAWKAAVAAGILSYVIVMITVGNAMKVKIPVENILISVVAASVTGALIVFFVRNLEGTGIEHLSFEDDEYYYYVKAVPKKNGKTQEKYIRDTKKTDDADSIDMSGMESDSQEKSGNAGVSQNTITFHRMEQFTGDIINEDSGAPVQEPENDNVDMTDYEIKLEESLKNL